MRQVLLKVGVARADDHQVRTARLHLGDHGQLAGHAHQRILRRLIPVRRREEGRALDVGIVVGAAAGEVDQPDAEVPEQVQEPEGLHQVPGDGVAGVGAESVEIGQVILEGLGDPRPRPASLGAVRIRPEGHPVEGREPDADGDRPAPLVGADALGDPAQEAGAVLEGAAELPRPREARQQLVAQVPVAVLDVDEVESRLAGDAGAGDVELDQTVQFLVRDRLLAGADPEPAVQDRVAVGDDRLRAVLAEGPAEPPGVGQLQACHQAFVGTEPLPVSAPEQPVQLGDAAGRLRGADQLVRVGPPLGADGAGLAAPDQLGPRDPEVAPALPHQIRGPAVTGPVPALHGMDGEAVPDAQAASGLDRLRQG